MKIWVFEALYEGVRCWLGKCALKMFSDVCSVLLQLFQLCFPLNDWPFLLIPPPAPPRWPHPTCPTPAVNYCFNSRAKSCSECLQAGKGCAYCPEEVRGQNSRNESSQNKVVGKTFLLVAQYWLSKEGIIPNLLQFALHTLKRSELLDHKIRTK